MDLLIVDALDQEVIHWLESRHSVRVAPELADDPREFRQALYNVRALILPASVAFSARTLQYAPMMRAVGRINAGAENIDLDACARNGVEVVRRLHAELPATRTLVLTMHEDEEYVLHVVRAGAAGYRALGALLGDGCLVPVVWDGQVLQLRLDPDRL